MKSFNSSACGQTFVEFVFSLMLAMTSVLAVGACFQSVWLKSQCAYWVFESTHAHLIGLPQKKSRYAIQIHESEDEVTGDGRCGKMVEKVTLPKLESANWTH